MELPKMPDNWGSMSEAEKADFMKKNTATDTSALKTNRTTPKKEDERVKGKSADQIRKETAGLIAMDKSTSAADPNAAIDGYERGYKAEEDKQKGKRSLWGAINNWLAKEAGRFNGDTRTAGGGERNGDKAKETRLDYTVSQGNNGGTNSGNPGKSAQGKAQGSTAQKEIPGANDAVKKAVTAVEGNKTIKQAAQAAAGTLKPEEAMLASQSLTKALQSASKNIDIHERESLPKWLIHRYRDGEFTANNKMQEYQKAQSDLKSLKKSLKEKGLSESKINDIKARIAGKEDEIAEIKSSKDFKDGKRLFYSLMANSIATKLINGYSILKGGGAVAQSAAQKINDAKLKGALDRYNEKWGTMARNDASMLYTEAKEQQDAYNRINRWLSDASLRPYIQSLDLENKKELIEWEKKMGRSITADDVKSLAKYNLLGTSEGAGGAVKGLGGVVKNAVGL